MEMNTIAPQPRISSTVLNGLKCIPKFTGNPTDIQVSSFEESVRSFSKAYSWTEYDIRFVIQLSVREPAITMLKPSIDAGIHSDILFEALRSYYPPTLPHGEYLAPEPVCAHPSREIYPQPDIQTVLNRWNALAPLKEPSTPTAQVCATKDKPIHLTFPPANITSYQKIVPSVDCQTIILESSNEPENFSVEAAVLDEPTLQSKPALDAIDHVPVVHSETESIEFPVASPSTNSYTENEGDTNVLDSTSEQNADQMVDEPSPKSINYIPDIVDPGIVEDGPAKLPDGQTSNSLDYKTDLKEPNPEIFAEFGPITLLSEEVHLNDAEILMDIELFPLLSTDTVKLRNTRIKKSSCHTSLGLTAIKPLPRSASAQTDLIRQEMSDFISTFCQQSIETYSKPVSFAHTQTIERNFKYKRKQNRGL